MIPGKNILVLSDAIGAPSYAPRVRSVCRYLTDRGYHVHVVSEQMEELPFSTSYPLTQVPIYSGSGWRRRWRWALINIGTLLFEYKDRYFSHRLEQIVGTQHFDLVFCSTFHTFPLRSAVIFARKRHIPVVLDLRDIMEQAPQNTSAYLAHQLKHGSWLTQLFLKIQVRRRNHWLRQANAVTTVSPWHQQILLPLNPNTHLIYNGFDEQTFQPLNQHSSEFILSYTGRLYPYPMQDCEPLFEALASLNIPYRLIIHTQEQGIQRCQQLVDKYQLSDHVSIGGYVSLQETMDIYRQSSIILAFSNSSQQNNVHGMMTTKFFEALGVEKPLLLVRSDEECLAQTMAYTHAGLAATSVEEIKQFILDRYHEWQTKGFTRQAVQHKAEFTRQYQAQQFEQIFLSLCQK